MFGMWNVPGVECWRCRMWDVGCGMFTGMWDVDLQNASGKEDSNNCEYITQ